MPASHVQQNFSGGELAAEIWGRTDIEKRATSITETDNVFVHSHGAISNRPGTKLIAPASTDTGNVNLIDFTFNTDDTYILEFTDSKIRVIRNDGFILEDDVSFSAITANVFASTAHGFLEGDLVYYAAKYYYIAAAGLTADAFTLEDRDGVASTFSDTSGTLARVYTIASPYLDADVNEIKHTQTSDTITLTHRNYSPRELTRESHDPPIWTLSEISFESSMGAPTGVTVKALSTNNSYSFKASNLDYVSHVFKLTSSGTKTTIRIQQLDSKGQFLTANTQVLKEGNIIYLSGATGMSQLMSIPLRLANRATATQVGDDTFDLQNIDGSDIDSSGYTAYTDNSSNYGDTLLDYKVTAVSKSTGEESLPARVTETVASDELSSDAGAYVAWSAPTTGDVEEYNIYRKINGIYGYVGTTKETAFRDNNIAPELSDNPPEDPARNPFLREVTEVGSANSVDITSISMASPTVITTDGDHGLTNGQSIVLEDILMDTDLGTLVLNTGFYQTSTLRVANASGNTFEVEEDDGGWVSWDTTDPTGAQFLLYGTYVSGGKVLRGGKVLFTLPSHGYTGGENVDLKGFQEPYKTGKVVFPEGDDVDKWTGSFDQLTQTGLTVADDEYLTKDTFTLVQSDASALLQADISPDSLRTYLSYYSTSQISDPTTTYEASGGVTDYPSIVLFHNQRRGFAGQTFSRLTLHWSETGDPDNFSGVSDAFSHIIYENQGHEIRHVVSGKTLLVFTSGSVIEVSSGEAGFSLNTVDIRKQTQIGVSKVAPVSMRDSILYIQDKHSRVFDLGYTLETDSYAGRELTQLVSHFIDDVTIDGWAIQEHPEPIVWCRMSDGSLKSLTYDKDNGVYAWCSHSTLGLFKNEASSKESSNHSVYFVVQRTIGGNTRQFIERLHHRDFSKVQDAKFLDSSISLDNPLTVTAITRPESSGVPATIKVTSASHGLSEDDVVELDNLLGMAELDNGKYRLAQVTTDDFYLVNRGWSMWADITGAVLDGTDVVITHNGTIEVSDGDAVYIEDVGGMTEINDQWFMVSDVTDTTFKLQDFALADIDGTGYTTYTASTGAFRRSTPTSGDATSSWTSGGEIRECLTSLSGLDHLEGETISALADGNVVEDLVVTSGAITIPNASARIHAGIPYQSTFKTLPPDSPQSDLSGEHRSIFELMLKLFRTRGIEFRTTGTEYGHLDSRSTEDWDAPAALKTGEYKKSLYGATDGKGQLEVIMREPLPVTIQSMGIKFNY